MQIELVVQNADIRTMRAERPRAEALAVAGGRIVALGSNADMLALAGPETRRLNAGGRMVLPGLQDAHIHLLNGGTDMVSGPVLYDATSVEALQAALRGFAKANPNGPVMGMGWQAGIFTDENLGRAVLDAAIPDRPCMLYDSSFHNAVINTAAMRAVALTTGQPDPPNGHFVLDAQGTPTGMLHEAATGWVRNRLPPTSHETHMKGLAMGQAHANRHGITGVLDAMIVDDNARAYAEAAANGTLTLRVAGTALVRPEDTAQTALERLSALRASHRDPLFTVHSGKFFFDGVLENRTAAMLEPYADSPGGNAPLMFEPAKIAALFKALDAARFQIHVHAIGDYAVRAALDGIESARRANGNWPALHQIAHIQMLHGSDLPRFRALGVMANMQPLWAMYDPVVPDLWMDMVGEARLPMVYALRDLLDAGAPLCLSSDFPVSTLNPFEIMQTAVTRAASAQARPFQPHQAITIAEALAGYTTAAAAACWRSHETGAIFPGAHADLIVIDRDISTCDPFEIGGTKVLATLLAGVEVYRDTQFDG